MASVMNVMNVLIKLPMQMTPKFVPKPFERMALRVLRFVVEKARSVDDLCKTHTTQAAHVIAEALFECFSCLIVTICVCLFSEERNRN